MLSLSSIDKTIDRVLRKQPPRVIVVVGSIGKSSTKYAISTMLSRHFRVNSDIGDANAGDKLKIAYFGISFKELRDPPTKLDYLYWLLTYLLLHWRSFFYPFEVLVLEVSETEAVQRQTELKRLLKKIKPELCVITGISGAHMGKIGDRNAISQSIKLVGSLCGNVIFNSDFKELSFVKTLPNYKSKYSSEHYYEKSKLIAHGQSGISAAIEVSKYFGLNDQDLQTCINTIEPLPGRMQQLVGIHGESIIDDTFNSSAEAAIAGLEYLGRTKGYKVAILGDINELGKHARAEHQKVAQIAINNAQLTVLVGIQTKKYMRDLISSRMPVFCFSNARDAGVFLAAKERRGWIIYAKGSQDKIYLEETIKPLMSRGQARKLPRQSRYWIYLKKHYFSQPV